MSQGSASDYQVHAWLQQIVASAYGSLHYDDPTLGAINNNEVSGGGYLRPQILFTAPVNRGIWNSADIIWNGLLQGQITHWGINDASAGGNLIYSGRLPGITSLLTGRGYRIGAGGLAVSFA